MKHFLVGIILLIVVLGAAAAASVYFKFGPLPHLLKLDVAKEAPPPPPPPKPVYVDVGSFQIPIIMAHQIASHVGLDLTLDVDPELAAAVTKDLPHLKDAYNIDLFDFVPEHQDLAVSDKAKALMHTRLLKIAVKLYGEKVIHDLIVKNVYER